MAKFPTIFDMANAFLSIEPMSNKKLQKMCYYAKAWHLAIEDENIINEQFQAWAHGPVNPQLYHRYKDNGYEAIPKYTDTSSIPADVLAFASKVYDSYGELDAYDLECLTHGELPWIEARGDLKPWESCNTEINEETMKTYYRNKMV